jgi:hypothetical protein
LVARGLGRAAMVGGRMLGWIHPVAGIAIQAASYGARQYGTSKINEGFAYNRAQETEADALAISLGFGRPLASALVKLERNASGLGALPPWSHSLLFAGSLNTADHPPTRQRVTAALAAPPDDRPRCYACGATLSVTGTCACRPGVAAHLAPCFCGAESGPADRYCGRCGRVVAEATCRRCGTPDSGKPFCSGCHLPLP